jgi:hypothetical protein
MFLLRWFESGLSMEIHLQQSRAGDFEPLAVC